MLSMRQQLDAKALPSSPGSGDGRRPMFLVPGTNYFRLSAIQLIALTPCPRRAVLARRLFCMRT